MGNRSNRRLALFLNVKHVVIRRLWQLLVIDKTRVRSLQICSGEQKGGGEGGGSGQWCISKQGNGAGGVLAAPWTEATDWISG